MPARGWRRGECVVRNACHHVDDHFKAALCRGARHAIQTNRHHQQLTWHIAVQQTTAAHALVLFYSVAGCILFLSPPHFSSSALPNPLLQPPQAKELKSKYGGMSRDEASYGGGRSYSSSRQLDDYDSGLDRAAGRDSGRMEGFGSDSYRGSRGGATSSEGVRCVNCILMVLNVIRQWILWLSKHI